jgi:hypothetical protein
VRRRSVNERRRRFCSSARYCFGVGAGGTLFVEDWPVASFVTVTDPPWPFAADFSTVAEPLWSPFVPETFFVDEVLPVVASTFLVVSLAYVEPFFVVPLVPCWPVP